MNRDYYYFREVFLGLREEYLKKEIELENLKKYVVCQNERVKDFYFWLFKSSSDHTQLWLTSIEKRKELLNFFRRVFGAYCIGYNESLINRDLNTKDIKIINNRYNFGINGELVEDLYYDIDKIFQSDFVRDMYLKYSDEFNRISLELTLTKMAFGKDKYFFDYYCYNNDEMISVVNSLESKSITVDQISDILDERISKNCFSRYHQEVIEKNKDLKELYIFDDVYRGGYANFEIEENNGIVLCKKIEKRKQIG